MTRPTGKWHGAAFLLLGLSCLQSARFLSLSNVLVIVILLLCLSGFSAHSKLPEIWIRWSEGLFSLVRPIGAIQTFNALTLQKEPGSSNKSEQLRKLFAVLFPAVFLVVIFGWLLGAGNAVLGKWNAEFLSALFEYLSSIELPDLRHFIWWMLFAAIALILVCPPKAGFLSNKLAQTWRQFGTSTDRLRLHQWWVCLGALNLLFLLSNVTDVVFLWFSRELPTGIYHSDYVHQGVYALIATTVLSAMIMALLTQHHEVVSRNRGIRSLTFLWMLQNAILISGVYMRLWMYVDAYGYTPKRVYVALFLALVIVGYGLLGWAIYRHKNIKWLIGANLILIFSYFSVLQFVDVPKWVSRQNIDLYQAQKISYPEALFLHQIGSHSVPFLISINERPQSAEDQQNALQDLDQQMLSQAHFQRAGWRGYQLRDGLNYQVLTEFKKSKPLSQP